MLATIGLMVLIGGPFLLLSTQSYTPPPAPPPHVETPQEVAAREARELREHPERFLTLASYSGENGGFGTVLIVSGTIRNRAAVAIRDPELTCEMTGASGTRLDRMRQPIYQVVPANGRVRFRRINMGFHNQQSSRFSCWVSGAAPAY